MIQDIAPHTFFNPFVPGKRPEPGDSVFIFAENRLMVRTDGKNFHLPTFEEIGESGGAQYLFALDGQDFYLAEPESGKPGSGAPDGLLPVTPQELRDRGMGPRPLVFAAWTAYHLACWYRNNRFCGRCGGGTVPAPDERALDCSVCGRRIYPRISPAIIAGVRDGDRLLLTKYADRPLAFYALVAGFTEIGETLEDTVRREVLEEVGLKVGNVSYYKSQPWGIAENLLAGFFCDVEGDTEIRLDGRELKEGVWVPREEVPGQPTDFSLTHEMMMAFKEGRDRR